MPKKAFVRQGGFLLDVKSTSTRDQAVVHVLASALGENLSPDDRRDALARIRQGATTLSLTGDRSAEYLEALLEAVRKLDIAAPMELVGFIRDSRVQPALVLALETASPRMVGNFAQAVGLVGGPGAREALRRWLKELCVEPATWRRVEFVNALAASLSSVSCALFRLEPDCMDAVHALKMLFSHPCPFNQRSAYAAVTSSLRTTERGTLACLLLVDELDLLVNTADDGLFLTVCSALSDRKAVLRRLSGMLNTGDEDVRHAVIEELLQLSNREVSAVAMVRDHFAEEPALGLRLAIAKKLAGLLPGESAAPAVEAGLADESPLVRLAAIEALVAIDGPQRQAFAVAALTDEPDPTLRRKLEEEIARES